MLQNSRILVIEDEVLISLDVQRCLEAAGAVETVAARSPAEAMRMAADWPGFDLALLDARMGAADAVTLARDLDAAGVAVVVASADTGVAALFARATLLDKPFGEAELLAACRSALASNGP